MRADHVGRIPVGPVAACPPTPASGSATGACRQCAARRRTNALSASGAPVVARQPTVLGLGVDEVRVFRIGPRLEAVAAGDVIPVARADAQDVERTRRAAHGEVILRAAADRVKRLLVANADFVELRDGQVREHAPRLAIVVRFVDTTVVADDDVIAVGRVEDHLVMVDVHGKGTRAALDAHVGERLAGVLGPLHVGVDHPHGVGVTRIDVDLRVVRRSTAAFARHALPGHAVVVGLVKAATIGFGRRIQRRLRRRCRSGDRRLGASGPRCPGRALSTCRVTTTSTAPAAASGGRKDLGIDERVDASRLLRVGRERDAAHFARRQALGQFVPGPAAVGGLEHATIRSAANHLADMTHALVRAGEQGVGISRIKREVGEPRRVVHVERTGPCGPTVRGLVDAALAPRREQRSLCCDPDDVGVGGIHQNLADVLGGREARTRPRLTGVGRLVEAIAKVGGTLAGVFARAQPHHIGILRVHHHAAHVVRRVVIEDRLKRDAPVDRFPQPTKRGGDVPDAGILRVDLNILNAAGDHVRGQTAERERAEGIGGQARRLCLTGAGRRYAGAPKHGHECCCGNTSQESFHHCEFSDCSAPGLQRPGHSRTLCEDGAILPGSDPFLIP